MLTHWTLNNLVNLHMSLPPATWGSRRREGQDPPGHAGVVGLDMLPYLPKYLHQDSNMQLIKQFYRQQLTCNPNSPEKVGRTVAASLMLWVIN